MCDEAGGCQSVKLPDALGNFRGVCPSKSGETRYALRNGIIPCPRLRAQALSYSARRFESGKIRGNDDTPGSVLLASQQQISF